MNTTLEQPAVPAAAPFRIEPITYPVLAEHIGQLAEKYLPLRIAGVDDREGTAAVHAARMEIKTLRVNVEKRRKELKASALEYCRKVDDAAKKLTELLAPIELHLEGEEDRIIFERNRIKVAAEEARRKLVQERVTILAQFAHVPDLHTIGDLTAEQFAAYIAPIQKAHEEAAAERERLAKLEAERLEAERVERQRIEAQEAAERAELAKQQAEERRRLDAERAELDRQRREQQAEADRIAAEQRAENDRLAAERKRIADEQAERDRAAAQAKATVEAEQRAEADRLRVEAIKPDRDKLLAFAERVRDVATKEFPELSEAAAYQARVAKLAVINAAEKIRSTAKEMV